jgi:hypothetical protein
MKKTVNKKQTSKKKKEITYEISFSDEPCTHEESIKAVAELCLLFWEGDRDYHRKKIKEEPQYCDYCGKEITELYDFFSPDDRNSCYECARKVVDNPKRQKTFCGIRVAPSKK